MIHAWQSHCVLIPLKDCRKTKRLQQAEVIFYFKMADREGLLLLRS
ncbi:hypothetical protein [Rubritalea tangerina]